MSDFKRCVSMLAAAGAVSAGSVAFAQRDVVFFDDFDGTQLDTTKWERQVGRGEAYGLPTGWGNNELQYYTGGSGNSFVQDGNLNILVKRENVGGASYTSARLRTLNKVDFTYGRVEARIKLPSGAGYWPAFWMLPTGSPYGGWAASGEIDIMESTNIADRVYTTIHYGGGWPRNQSFGTGFNPGFDLSQSFNNYAVEWEPGRITWYFNDQQLLTRTSGQWFSENEPAGFGRPPFDVAFHMLLNVAVGGNFPGPPDASTVFPQSMQVDWVRVTREVQKPFNGAPAAIPGRIQAEDFDEGYPDDAYKDTEASNLGNAYRMEEVDIEANAGGFNVGWIRTGEFLEYTVNVPTAGEYTFTARVASESNGGAFSLSQGGSPISDGVTFDATGGWQQWTEVSGQVTFGSAGPQVVRLVAQEGDWNFDWIEFSGPDDGRCGPADIIQPLGQLTFADISGFLVYFNAQQPEADLAAPFGAWTFADISAFLSAYLAGCP